MHKYFYYHQQVKFLLVMIFPFFQLNVFGQFEYNLKVVDISNGHAISKASVYISGSTNYYTDANGFLKIQSNQSNAKFYIFKENYFGSIVILNSARTIHEIALSNRTLEVVEIFGEKINYVEQIENLLLFNNDNFKKEKDTIFYKFSKYQVLNRDTIKELTGNMFALHKGYKTDKKNNRGYISDYSLTIDSSACFSSAMDSIVYFSILSVINRDILLKNNIKEYIAILNSNKKTKSSLSVVDSNFFQLTFNFTPNIKEIDGVSYLEWSYLFHSKDSLIKNFYGNSKVIYIQDPLGYDSISFFFEMTYSDSIPKQLVAANYLFNIYTDGNIIEQIINFVRIPKFSIKELNLQIREYGPLNYQEM